jgi:hypothetical protein
VAENLAWPTTTPRVVLKNRPVWMSQNLAEQIARSVQPEHPSSSLDHSLLRQTAETLGFSPWVKEVRQVRRVFGQSAGDTIEIDCDFRTPAALVAASTGEYILVDSEGIKLPERFPVSAKPPRIMFGPDGHVTLRIIEGVTANPPFADGQKWAGEDLAAGLELLRLLYGRACTEEIYKVNVSNYKGRRNNRDPQLTLVTKYNSVVWWGEPVKQTFFAELHPAEKLERLALLKERYGRVDAGFSWIDIRLDQVQYPSEEASRIVHASSSSQSADQ